MSDEIYEVLNRARKMLVWLDMTREQHLEGGKHVYLKKIEREAMNDRR